MGVDASDIRTVIHTYAPPMHSPGEPGARTRWKHCHPLLLRGHSPPIAFTTIFTKPILYQSIALKALDEEGSTVQAVMSVTTGLHQTGGKGAILNALRYKPFSYTTVTLMNHLADDTIRHRHSGHLSSWQRSEIIEAIGLLIAEGKIRRLKRSGRLFCPLR